MAARVGLSRDDVVQAGVELADERGFENVTISEVARKLGVRSQSLYAHIDALAGLRRAIHVAAFQQLGERTRQAVEGLSSREAMMAWALAVTEFDAEHPGLFTARAFAPVPDEEVSTAVRQAEAVAHGLVRSFGVNEEDALHFDRMIWSALYGFEALRKSGRFRLAADPEGTLARLIAAIANDLELNGQKPTTTATKGQAAPKTRRPRPRPAPR